MMVSRYCLDRRRGFSLVELIVAVSILSVGIAVVVRSLIGFSGGFSALENQARATFFLESKLAEALRECAVTGKLAKNEDSGAAMLDRRGARWYLQSVPVEENPFGKDLEALTVRVDWKESGRAKEMSITRYIRQQRAQQP